MLSHAFKFTFAGHVDVALRTLPKHVELTVHDTGIGEGRTAVSVPAVPPRPGSPATAPARAPASNWVRRRTGARPSEKLEATGRIRVASEVDTDTTFTVWIPLGRRRRDETVEGQPPRISEIAAALAEEAEQWDAQRDERAARGHTGPRRRPAHLPKTASRNARAIEPAGELAG
ncbi:ATP-binding protein [Mycobacterium kansasii]